MKNTLICMLSVVMFWSMALAQTETEKSAIEKAKSFEDKEDYGSALKWYQKANKLNPKNGVIYYDIAWCQNELELYDDVVETATKGVSVSPSGKLYNEYGYALYKLKNYPQAIEKYKKALVLNPQESNAVKGLADSYFSNKDYDNALIYYKKCLEIGKEQKLANYKISWIMNDQKNYQKAVEYASAAIGIDDKYAEAYNELGYAYSQLDKKDLALENYKNAVEQDSVNATYNFNVADIYYAEGPLNDYDKAIDYYKKGIESDQKNAISYYRLGWILNDKEKYEEAQPYLYKAVEIDPKYSVAWLELGWIDFSNEKYSAAESKFIKAIQFDSKSELGRYYLGQVYIKQDKNSNAQKMVDELKGMSSKYADKLKAKM